MATSHLVQRRVIELIQARGMGAGDRLDPERDLITALRTSRNTLRKALAALKERGLLEPRGQAGTFIVGDPVQFLAPTPATTPGVGLSPTPSDPRTSSLVSVMLPTVYANARKQKWLHDHLVCQGCVLNQFLPDELRQDPAAERKFLESALRLRPRGILLLATPLAPLNTDMMALAQAQDLRPAHLDYYRLDLPDEAFFLPDHEGAGASALAWLASKGCRNVLVINANPRAPFVKLTQRGLRAAAGICGISVTEPPRAGPEAATGAIQRLFAAPKLAAQTGIVAIENLVGVNLVESLGPRARERLATMPMIAVGEYDAEFDRPSIVPLLAFSWRERVVDATAYITGQSTSACRRLYKPTLRPFAYAHG